MFGRAASGEGFSAFIHVICMYIHKYVYMAAASGRRKAVSKSLEIVVFLWYNINIRRVISMVIVIISLNVLAFTMGFWIGAYVYNKRADGNK